MKDSHIASRIAMTRRDALRASAVAALAAFLAPHMAMADVDAVTAELQKLYGDKTFASEKIKLDIPEIAENGLVVPVNVDVESPMTETDRQLDGQGRRPLRSDSPGDVSVLQQRRRRRHRPSRRRQGLLPRR